MLIWLELFAITIVIMVAWIYTRRWLAAAHGQGAVVDGIIYSIEDSSAIINGHLVKEGDTIFGATVVEIGRKTVEFEKDGERWEQRVRQRPNPAWKELD